VSLVTDTVPVRGHMRSLQITVDLGLRASLREPKYRIKLNLGQRCQIG
jgi:hypothetical protein